MYKWVIAATNRRERLSLRPLTLEEGGAVAPDRHAPSVQMNIQVIKPKRTSIRQAQSSVSRKPYAHCSSRGARRVRLHALARGGFENLDYVVKQLTVSSGVALLATNR